MNEFSLEKLTEQIYSNQTKEYFKEVISSYHNENYRSATVMLWSVVICDILDKLKHLVDIYEDKQAKTILNEIQQFQENNSKSPEWEMKIVEKVHKNTQLLNNIEFSNLEYLQTQRHLSAHPVLNSSNKLHSPNKETVRSLLRNTLEGVLIKPPFYTNKILGELLKDLADNSHMLLNNKEKIKRYVENKYFNKMTRNVELQLFKSLWKLVFRLKNEDCNKNREINYYLIWILAERNNAKIEKFILDNTEYFGDLSVDNDILCYVVRLLAELYPLEIYNNLPESTQIQIDHCIEYHHIGKVAGWFTKDSLDQHFDDLVNWISEDYQLKFSDVDLEILLTLQDSEEWEQKFCQLISIYYGKSHSFDQADFRFETSINIYLDKFNLNSFEFLLQKIEGNSQTNGRKRAYPNHQKIINRILELKSDFDFSQYRSINAIYHAMQPEPPIIETID